MTFSESSRLNLTIEGQARLANGQLVSGNFLSALGTRALLGRVLSPEDDRADALAYASVLSHGFWTRAFGGERAVLGRTLLVNGAPVVVVGVLPRGACGVDPAFCPDLMLPMAMQSLVDAGPDVLRSPGRWYFQVMGRLRPQVADEAARAETERLVTEAIRAAAPAEPWDPRVCCYCRAPRVCRTCAATCGCRSWCWRGPWRRCCSSPAPTSPGCCWLARARGGARSARGSRSAPAAGAWCGCC